VECNPAIAHTERCRNSRIGHSPLEIEYGLIKHHRIYWAGSASNQLTQVNQLTQNAVRKATQPA
jgi:hypothetical protein